MYLQFTHILLCTVLQKYVLDLGKNCTKQFFFPHSTSDIRGNIGWEFIIISDRREFLPFMNILKDKFDFAQFIFPVLTSFCPISISIRGFFNNSCEEFS